METYVNGAGKTITAEQAEQEYRKQLIVNGQPLEGEGYDRGLEAWLGTYRKLTKGDHRSINATVITFAIGVAVTALIAFVALLSGLGFIAFIVILLIGALISCGPAVIVMMLTSPKAT